MDKSNINKEQKQLRLKMADVKDDSGYYVGYKDQKDMEGSIMKKVSLKGKFCRTPWDYIDFQNDGRVFLCCSAWLHKCAGILDDKKSIDDVFNSKEAQDIRASILDGSFKYCNQGTCPKIQRHSVGSTDGTAEVLPDTDKLEGFGGSNRYKDIVENNQLTSDPIFYNLTYDNSCNLACPSCRVEKFSYTSGPHYERALAIQNKIIKKIFNEPHDKHYTVNVTGSGDPFGSKLFRDLLYSIDGSKYPNVKINLQTNGVMFTPKNWDKIKKIHNNINEVNISLDAGTEETYNIVRKGGHWPTLMKNIAFLSERKKEYGFHYCFAYVVQRENYKEMKDFIKIGLKAGVDQVRITLMNDWGTFEEKDFEERSIWKKENPHFEDFINELKDDIFNEKIVVLQNVSQYREYALEQKRKEENKI